MIVLIAVVAVLVVGLAAALAFGGGAWMSVRSGAPTSTAAGRPLPDGEFYSDDVEALRFDVAIRGYRMDQVDAALERLRLRLAELEDELAAAPSGPVFAEVAPTHPASLLDEGPGAASTLAAFPIVPPPGRDGVHGQDDSSGPGPRPHR